MNHLFASGVKYWSFSSSTSPSNKYSGLISFRIDWVDLLAIQGTLQSLLQHHNLKASVLSLLYSPALTSTHDYWKNADSSVGEEFACSAGNPSSILGMGRSAGEGIGYSLQYSWASLVAQLVNNLPAMRETWVQSLGWEDPLAKGKAPTPVFWPGEFHGLYSPWGCKESDTIE